MTFKRCCVREILQFSAVLVVEDHSVNLWFWSHRSTCFLFVFLFCFLDFCLGAAALKSLATTSTLPDSIFSRFRKISTAKLRTLFSCSMHIRVSDTMNLIFENLEFDPTPVIQNQKERISARRRSYTNSEQIHHISLLTNWERKNMMMNKWKDQSMLSFFNFE